MAGQEGAEGERAPPSDSAPEPENGIVPPPFHVVPGTGAAIVAVGGVLPLSAHETRATAASVFSKYSTRMRWRPAARPKSATYVVAGCRIHASRTIELSTQTRIPSSAVIVKRYVPAMPKSQFPVHRTENVSGSMRGSGDPRPQSKSIFGSVRLNIRFVRSALSK